MADSNIQKLILQPNYELENNNIQVTNYTSSNLLTTARDSLIMVQVYNNVNGTLYIKTNHASNPVFIPIINVLGNRPNAWVQHSIFLPKGSQIYGEISGGTGFIVCYYFYIK